MFLDVIENESITHFEILVKPNSKLRHRKIAKNSRYSTLIAEINENSTYCLNSTLHSINSQSFNNNSAILKGVNSKAKLMVNAISQKNSLVVNDADIVIMPNAENSQGIQNLKNLIINKESNSSLISSRKSSVIFISIKLYLKRLRVIKIKVFS
ncbi:MAG: hypothetical protein ACOCXG_03660 [Nanoarchaeota archaeon]